MNRDRSLLFAALCLQTGRIDSDQFAMAFREYAVRSEQSPGDILEERGWIQPADRPHLEYLCLRCLDDHAGDANAALSRLVASAQTSAPDLAGLLSDATVIPSLPANEVSQPDGANDIEAMERSYSYMSVHGTGGMGRVWRARDRQFGREVALKELRPELAGNGKTKARFVREARLTGRLEHPGIVPVYELADRTDTGGPFYTMRFVRGGTLTEAIRAYHARRRDGQAGPLELVRLLTAFVSVCNTIAYAHSRRVLHRDLKGDNVVLGDFGEVIVLDWGLAKRLDHIDEEDADVPEDLCLETHDAGLTIQGEIMGTPAYMAPEQAEGRLEQINERTDVYGLGAMLYEILTGKPPFIGSNTIEVLQKAIRGNPPPPRELCTDVSPALEEICLRALARDPADRYARAEDLAQQVLHWQEDQRRRAEDALRRQTEVLRSILNSMSEGVLVSDETGRIMLVNPAAENIFGSITETTIAESHSVAEFYGPDQVTRFEVGDLPLARAIRGEEVNDVEMFIRLLASDNGFWASANARPLKDETGALRGGVVVFRDITERKRVETELIRSRERFELAVQGSQDGLWDWDPQTGEIYYSPRWKSILGYEDDEIEARIEEWERRIHPDDRERVLQANQAHIDGITPHYDCEYRLQHKDGTYRWILARGVALRDADGKAFRIAGSHVDITDRKQAEELRGT
ncbi:protein kinase domain-containing protein [Planctomicrobium sp. SH664]|uniref:protein kinase domain-containing protein n=1 Tax=Planctomicrobium sp. SH664 TaxID=3448125 RepID=UPI003F5B52E4